MPSPALTVPIALQPTETTCGPTCLQAVYAFYGDTVSLGDLVEHVPSLANGGTLAVILGRHALSRGYHAKIYTFNLHVVDPTWFNPLKRDLGARLLQREQCCRSRRQRTAINAYRRFVEEGGELQMKDLSPNLLVDHLSQGQPILAGLSSTFLYQSSREDPVTNLDDDILGEPAGHFVVLTGYDATTGNAAIADPYSNPFTPGPYYSVPWHRLAASVLLGAMTYDANLLVLLPGNGHSP
jgi:hypothetical protein